MVLENLQPRKMFTFFEEICRIPHGSRNEKALSDYLVKFARDRGLDVVQDAAYNVFIKKGGTKGREALEPVILQGHIDMVCEKNIATVHDFIKDPIKLYVDGDFIKAEGTTLGADNGIAVAMIMAVLDSDDNPHPPLEVILTTAEEVGMDGAHAFDGSLLSSKRLINLDSEEDGVFTVCCAGGMRASLLFDAAFEKCPEDFVSYRVGLRGLVGGHSGGDIICERANANRLTARILSKLSDQFDMNISDFNGGIQDNAIPRECSAVVSFPAADTSAARAVITALETAFRHEFRKNEPGLSVLFEKVQNPAEVLTKETGAKAVKAVLLCPNGVQAMSLDMEGLVETSNSIGVVRTTENAFKMTSCLRSSVVSRKQFMLSQIELLASLLGGRVETASDYPAWEYRPDSPLRGTITNVYKDMFRETPKVFGTHGGLECGLFIDKIKDLDIVSFGPDIRGAHTPEERLSIASSKRMWEFLLAVLSAL